MRFDHKLNHRGGPICQIEGCRETIPWNAPAPVCRDHGIEIARVYYDVVRHERARVARAQAVARDATKPVEMRKAGREVVYYVRIGDYVKIGYTKRLRERIRQLRADFEDLMAIEDGDRALEAERHHQFRGDRLDMRRENFRPSDALMGHIHSIGGRATLPDWARLPDAGKVRFRSVS